MSGEFVARVRRVMLIAIGPVAMCGALLAGWRGALGALAVGMRHLALFGALAVALWSGAAHPVALLMGLTVLPPVVIALGLLATAGAR